jgi:hypothetical protein
MRLQCGRFVENAKLHRCDGRRVCAVNMKPTFAERVTQIWNILDN